MKFFLTLCTLFSLLNVIFALPVEKRGAIDSALSFLVGDFEGQATYFKPKTEGGPIGACGKKEDDDSQIVALNLHQYGSENSVSEWCNRKVFIRHGDKHTTATINDACPGCSRNSLDLTPSVFEKLAAFKTGVVPIQWCVIGTEGCDKLMSGGGKKSKE